MSKHSFESCESCPSIGTQGAPILGGTLSTEMSSQIGYDNGQCDYHNHHHHSGTDAPKRTQKRKRVSTVPFTMSAEQRQARIDALRQELDGLFAYYKEAMTHKLIMDFNHCTSTNAIIAFFMEESHLPLSSLVSHIYDILKDAQNAFLREPVTLAFIKTSVLSVGQRFMYGIPNADADVLEDDSESCLWCWETRDIRLLPKPLRGEFNVRRIFRKRIHDRIAAVSAMVSALQNSDVENNCKYDLFKETEKLVKTFCVADIRSLVDQLSQQKSAEMAEKETKRQEKLIVRQMEKSRRETEKEKRRMDNELKMEKSQIMEQEKHHEMEVYEMRKQLGKQLEESEKHQRRREKEMAEMKRKQSLQKQVSIMERFLKRTKTSGSCEHYQFPNKVKKLGSTGEKIQNVSEAVTLFIDSTLTCTVEINDDILKSHLSSWHSLARSIRLKREQHWGVRQKPKTELFKELKLTDAKEYAGDDDLNTEQLVDRWPEPIMIDRSCHTEAANYFITKMHYQRKQLLQFDNSPRPAFYGIWPKKSDVVGARRPFRKDPELDYDVNSDEEWEEEESGESLSDCEIDEEEENLDGCSKSDGEDDTEDGFFVPDGYLSENEGVQLDRMKMGIDIEEARSSPDCEKETEDGEFSALLQQEKYLNNLTEHALRVNQPFVVLDLVHDKASLLIAQSTIGTLKLEEKCLRALRMRAIPDRSTVEVPGDDMEKVKESPSSFSKVCTILDVTSVPESELSTVVSAIQTCSQGINKVLDCLQQKFPAVSKSSLKNKVREISYFAGNQWQVKKEVLDKLGLASSPEKRNGEVRNISTYFSKRCLPPAGEDVST